MEQLLNLGLTTEDFPEVGFDKDHPEDITFRYRMSDRDVFYLGGVVNGARNITLMEDTAKRLMAREFGSTWSHH